MYFKYTTLKDKKKEPALIKKIFAQSFKHFVQHLQRNSYFIFCFISSRFTFIRKKEVQEKLYGIITEL